MKKPTLFILVFVMVLAIFKSTHAEVFILQPGPEDGMDVWVTNVYHGGGKDVNDLRVGGWGDWYYSLIKFDIESLPPGVAFAKIEFFAWNNRDPSPTMYLDRVTSYWEGN